MGVVSLTRRLHLTPGGNNIPEAIGGWFGLGAGLDTEARGKKSFASAEDRTPAIQFVVHHTD
jgi:hypothetical protein